MSSDIILMSDEIYFQKSSPFKNQVGSSSANELFSGIVVFMIVELKQSIPSGNLYQFQFLL